MCSGQVGGACMCSGQVGGACMCSGQVGGACMCSIHTLYVGIAQTNVLPLSSSLIISKAMMLSLLLVWM